MVLVLLFRFLTWVPAYVAIGIWFAFQVIEGLGMFGGSQQGVAYGAHIGGFVFGMIVGFLVRLGRRAPRPYVSV